MQQTTPNNSVLIRLLTCTGIACVCLLAALSASAMSGDDAVVTVEPAELLSPAELQELVAPIALYSDELLAIVLPASTYPLQVVAAARYRDAVVNDPKLEPEILVGNRPIFCFAVYVLFLTSTTHYDCSAILVRSSLQHLEIARRQNERTET